MSASLHVFLASLTPFLPRVPLSLEEILPIFSCLAIDHLSFLLNQSEWHIFTQYTNILQWKRERTPKMILWDQNLQWCHWVCFLLAIFLLRVSIVNFCNETQWPKEIGEKTSYLAFLSIMKSGQELKQDKTWRKNIEATEECCLLSCSLSSASILFYF